MYYTQKCYERGRAGSATKLDESNDTQKHTHKHTFGTVAAAVLDAPVRLEHQIREASRQARSSMNINNLVQHLTTRSLPTDGLKPALVARLEQRYSRAKE